MKLQSYSGRIIKDKIIKILSVIAAIFGIFLLFIIIKDVTIKGLSVINWAFLTNDMKPTGIPGGGIRNAIYGTLMITLVASLIGIPLGLFIGIFLSEYERGTFIGRSVRFVINVLMGIPSILIGIFFFAFMIVSIGHGSGYVGAFALAVIMVPIIAVTTEEMLLMVPDALRESALAIGMPKWKIIIYILFKYAKNGLLTGILLAVARVSGETAPLIFTARFSQFWSSDLNKDTANLTMTIYNYAGQPYDDLVNTAWGASLLVMFTVLLVTIIAKTVISHKK